MWQVKTFKTSKALHAWVDANDHRFQIVVLFVNNGYAVEYKKLRQIG